MVDSPSTVDRDLATAAEILSRGEGVAWAYQLLREMAARHDLTDAWLVVRPDAGPGQGGTAAAGAQVFALGGAAVPVETIRTLLGRPPGLYGAPERIDAATSHALGAMCGAAFRAAVAGRDAAIDPASGLASMKAIRAAVARATASGARYGWSSTLVLLTTGGDSAAADRWLALAGALRQALRTGDEAGVTRPGVALAILGNAGPDAVRPFVARVRAALSADGWDDIDLHASTARTPEETVDPAELTRLAAERLVGVDVGIETGAGGEGASMLELELRLFPGVKYVAMSTPVVVVASSPEESLHDELLRAVRAHLPDASVRLIELPDQGAGPERSFTATAFPHVPEPHHTNGNGAVPASTHPASGREAQAVDARSYAGSEGAAPRAISATAPRGPAAASRDEGARVSLLTATFDKERGTSEVSLALGAARGTGRASAGALAGGAQATLNALSALEVDVPYYLVSVERAHGVPGEPVVVVLAPKRSVVDGGGRAVERLGVATGADDVEAASRATLGALNRHLARSRATS